MNTVCSPRSRVRSRLTLAVGLACLLTCTLSPSAVAQITVPGADGSDGEFNPTSSVNINLALADTAAWDGPNPNPGEGVYDPDKWAIVFRYSSVNIPSNVTVTFLNHPANPPVVWLVSGSTTINGNVYVRSPAPSPHPAFYDDVNMGIPAPGGFRGGGTNSMGGLGPGGAVVNGAANYASGTGAYGNARCLPLIGGSGGGGAGNGRGAGGAILIAATSTVSLNGFLSADYSNAGSAGQSGGAVRVVCNRLEGVGSVAANGITALQHGRIRIEANEMTFGSVGLPQASFGLPGTVAVLWPEDLTPTPPRVEVVSLGAESIPSEPRASFAFPFADVNSETPGTQTLVIECQNIPTGSDPPGVAAWNVVARVVPRGSAVSTINATYVGGDFALSTWHAQVPLTAGFSAIQVRASMPPQ